MVQEFKLKEKSRVFGLRETGKIFRQMIEGFLVENQKIIIDFEEVESISSSFADEFIAKIYLDLGKEKFSHLVKFKNVNNFVKTIINSTIKQRLQSKV